MKRFLAVFLVGLMALVVATVASADTISITVGGTGPLHFPGPVTPPANAPWGVDGYPGDTVELTGTTFNLDLTPGTYTKKINTLLWTVDYTYGGTATDPNAWSDLFFSFNLSRTISLGADPLQQPGALKATWENDFLGLSSGAAQTFLVPGFQIVVTPLGLAEVGASNFDGGNPWVQPARDVQATFEVTATAVPDSGATLALLGCALIGLGALRRRFGA